jgi:hypothetical protein
MKSRGFTCVGPSLASSLADRKMIQSLPSGESVRRIFYRVALGSIFAWAAWGRFSLPLDPIADLDIWGYLSPALFKLTGGEFVHFQGRNFVYPGFLFLLLRTFGDFRAINIAQHILGLAGGGLILMTWQKLRGFIASSKFGDRAHTVLGLVLVAVFLLAGEPIRAEMGIRPEGLCAFLLALNLYFLSGFLAGKFFTQQSPVAWGIGLGASAVLLAALKPSFVILALIPLLPIALFIVTRNPLRQKIALALGIALATALIAVPEHFLSRGDDQSSLFLPTTLFVVHADLIRDQLADDVASGANLPYETERLGKMQKKLAVAIAKSAAAEGSRFPSLGFSPDYLQYDPASIAEQVAQEFNYDIPAIVSFYQFCYRRTWQQRPVGMLKKVGRQVALFYAPISPVYDRRKTIPLALVYGIGAHSFDPEPYRKVFSAYPPALEFIRRSALLGETALPIEQSRLTRTMVTFLACSYRTLLALTLVIAAACLRTAFRKKLGPLAIVTLLVFAYNAAACLEVAIVQVFDGPRYSTVQFCFTVFAEFLALRLVLETALQMIRWGRPIQTSTPGE